MHDFGKSYDSARYQQDAHATARGLGWTAAEIAADPAGAERAALNHWRSLPEDRNLGDYDADTDVT